MYTHITHIGGASDILIDIEVGCQNHTKIYLLLLFF